MGIFSNLFSRKKEIVPISNDVLICVDETDEDAVSTIDYQYSQSVFDRNLVGVIFYEIEPELLTDNVPCGELYVGEFIEIVEGRMSLGVRTRNGDGGIFDCDTPLSLSYSRHGEAFYLEAKIIKATSAEKEAKAAFSVEDNDETSEYESITPESKWSHYIVDVVLCSEAARHRRLHGRVAIEWNVYYRIKSDLQGSETQANEETSYLVTKTIDISEGGFKSIVENRLDRDTEIECIVEVDNNLKSEGALFGRVIRSDFMADNIEMFEMTIQFTQMDERVRGFLVECIKKEQPGAVDSEAVITISADCLEASIELTAPRNNGSDLSYEELCNRLTSECVTFGVDHAALHALSEKPCYNLKLVIAHGKPPIDGDDAELTYYVDMNPVKEPKVQEDGTIDFKDLGLIKQVSTNDVLVEKRPLTEGVSGICVTGDSYMAKPGKDVKLPSGTDTYVNETGTALLAAIDGGVSIVGDLINVFSTYIVDGDVHYETGSINHNGIVVVKGDVRYGFAVEATGDVLIHGTVESATIKAGGSLVVRGGCVGEESSIEAGGAVAVKFIDGGSITSRGNLQTSYIIGSTIKCGGSIDMIGSGIIRNSHVVAQTEINAKVIGSIRAAADKTVVEVGNDPELLNRYVAASKRLDQLKEDMESFETTIRALTIRKYKKELSPEKLNVLEKTKLLEKHYVTQHEELTDECKMLKEQINKLGYGTIRVQNTAYEGLRIIIGSSTLVLKDSIKAVKFYRNEEGITFSPLK